MSDSTNVEKEGRTVSDEWWAKALKKSSPKVPLGGGPFCLKYRPDTAGGGYHQTGRRKIVFNGRSIEWSVQTALDLNMLHIPAGMEIDVEQIEQYPSDEILVMTTAARESPCPP
ncbi:MAG: hypothetical protein R2874_01715 [Desulfobacterales bacterium]